ncbi:hypothetical protein VCSRO55_0734 [Vibrio cholerae]|nr:hypothetical protein VCSRO55_0734 [Vibrio cholerae]
MNLGITTAVLISIFCVSYSLNHFPDIRKMVLNLVILHQIHLDHSVQIPDV